MGIITQDMRAIVDSAKLAFLATARLVLIPES